MPQAFKYPVSPLLLSDYIIASDTSEDNVTRNFSVSGIVDSIRGSMGIATVTSISTAPSRFISLTSTPGTITTTGTITASLLATGLPAAITDRKLYFLRGDGQWILPGPAPTEITGFNEDDFLGKHFSNKRRDNLIVSFSSQFFRCHAHHPSHILHAAGASFINYT